MRTVKALVTYDKSNGEAIKRENVSVSFTYGEPDPKDQLIAIEWDGDSHTTGKAIYLTIRTLEKACNLKIKRLKSR